MMNVTNKTFYLIFVAVLLLLPTVYVQALSMSAQLPQEQLEIGKTSLIKISLENRDQAREINALEGVVKISSPKQVMSIITGGSIFNLWPVRPSLDQDSISFVGGTQSGVFGGSLRVFTLAVKPDSAKDIRISFEGVNAYLNDGKGTKVAVVGTPVTLKVAKAEGQDDELHNLISSDTAEPQNFAVDLGRDPALYDGQYFISFYTSDNESGIKTYEVTESGFATVRTEGVYVLQDQNLNRKVTVKAIDNAGNERVAVIRLGNDISWLKFFAVAVLLGLAGALSYLAIKFFYRKNEKII